MSIVASRTLPRLRLRNVFLRRTDWSGADLSGADISGSDVSHASFVGADFGGATIEGTILRGADLTGARNLKVEQLQSAVIDEATRLPDYINRSQLPVAHNSKVRLQDRNENGGSADSTREIITRISPPWSGDQLALAMAEVARDYGFSHAASFSLPSTDDVGLATRVLHSNWSPAFARGYEAHGLHKCKIVVGTLQTDPMPFVWDIETLYGSDEPDPTPAARFLLQEGYLAGVLLPVHSMTSFRGALSFAGAKPNLSEQAVAELHRFAFIYFSMLAAVRFEEDQRNNLLSARERDCLKLAMLGKTSSEIGMILSLSEYTVLQYLSAAQRKMKAENINQAVDVAIHHGYLT